MKTIKKIEFKAALVKEFSATSRVEKLGTMECTMELFQGEKDPTRYMIEWVMERNGDLCDVQTMGIQTRDGIVTDYDGCFELPSQAIELLNSIGLNTEEL